MLNALFKFLVYRFAGARILLALSALGWLRNRRGRRREGPDDLSARPAKTKWRGGPTS
jgi:hypothetical protein